jgi:hypothetical protein
MQLGAASRYLVGVKGWSLRTSAESLRRVYRGRGSLELRCLTLLRESLGFGNLRGSHTAGDIISIICRFDFLSPSSCTTQLPHWHLPR